MAMNKSAPINMEARRKLILRFLSMMNEGNAASAELDKDKALRKPKLSPEKVLELTKKAEFGHAAERGRYYLYTFGSQSGEFMFEHFKTHFNLYLTYGGNEPETISKRFFKEAIYFVKHEFDKLEQEHKLDQEDSLWRIAS
jgi:hypothetical protein